MIESPKTSMLNWRSGGVSGVNGGELCPQIEEDRTRAIAATAASGCFMKCEKVFMPENSPPILAHALLRVTSNYSPGGDSVWLWHAHLARDSRAGRPCHFLKKIFQQVERNSQAIIPRRAQIIDRRNLCGERR